MNKETSGVDTKEINEKEMKDDKKKDALVTCRILLIKINISMLESLVSY